MRVAKATVEMGKGSESLHADQWTGTPVVTITEKGRGGCRYFGSLSYSSQARVGFTPVPPVPGTVLRKHRITHIM